MHKKKRKINVLIVYFNRERKMDKNFLKTLPKLSSEVINEEGKMSNEYISPL